MSKRVAGFPAAVERSTTHFDNSGNAYLLNGSDVGFGRFSRMSSRVSKSRKLLRTIRSTSDAGLVAAVMTALTAEFCSKGMFAGMRLVLQISEIFSYSESCCIIRAHETAAHHCACSIPELDTYRTRIDAEAVCIANVPPDCGSALY